MLIGVTGGVGGGKSLVSQQLVQALDGILFSADDVCRELLEPEQPGYVGLVTQWGDRFLDDERNINRPSLRTAIYRDRSVREKLEKILHPLVRRRLEEVHRSLESTAFLIAEIPLLYECDWQDDFDWIISVYLPADLAAQRVAGRDGVSPEEARLIIATQLAPEVKKKRADSVIDNRGTPATTQKQVNDLAHFLRLHFSPEGDGK